MEVFDSASSFVWMTIALHSRRPYIVTALPLASRREMSTVFPQVIGFARPKIAAIFTPTASK